MFLCQGLFLVATISAARVVFADILIQNRHNVPDYPQYKPTSQYDVEYLARKYQKEQLANQQLIQHPSWGIRPSYSYPYYGTYEDQAHSNSLVHPLVGYPSTHYRHYPYYGIYEDQAHSNSLVHPLVGYPSTHYHHYPPYHYHHYSLPKPMGHLHYAKLGGQGYVRPSVFVGNPGPLIVHHRYKRSSESPTSIESDKPAIATHNDDVATESPVSQAKEATVIDSLLPENEPTDTNDKHVEKRQSKTDHVTTVPYLLGLYPEKMYPMYRQAENSDKEKDSFLAEDPFHNDNSKHSDAQYAANLARLYEPAAEKTLVNHQEEGQYQEIPRNHEDPRLAHNKPIENSEQSSMPQIIPALSQELPEQKLVSHIAYDNYYDINNNRYQDALTWPSTGIKFYPTIQYESRWPYYPPYNPIEAQSAYPVLWDKIKYTLARQQPNQESSTEPVQETTNFIINKATPWNRNNDGLPKTNEIIDATQAFNDNSYGNLDNYWNNYLNDDSYGNLNNYWDNYQYDYLNDYLNDVPPYLSYDFNRRRYSTVIPSMKIPDVSYTDISARNEPATVFTVHDKTSSQTKEQLLGGYDHRMGHIYAPPQSYKYYYDTTVPKYKNNLPGELIEPNAGIEASSVCKMCERPPEKEGKHRSSNF